MCMMSTLEKASSPHMLTRTLSRKANTTQRRMHTKAFRR